MEVLQLGLLPDSLHAVLLLLHLFHHERVESVAGHSVVQFINGLPVGIVVVHSPQVHCLFPGVPLHHCVVIIIVVLLYQTVFTYFLLHLVETGPLFVEFVFEEVSERVEVFARHNGVMVELVLEIGFIQDVLGVEGCFQRRRVIRTILVVVRVRVSLLHTLHFLCCIETMQSIHHHFLFLLQFLVFPQLHWQLVQ